MLKQGIKTVTASALAVLMCGMQFVTALGNDTLPATPADPQPIEIVAFAALTDEVASQTIAMGSEETPVLPETLTAILATEETSTEEAPTAEVAVDWALAGGKTFATEEEGDFAYTASLTAEGYTVADTATLPRLLVSVLANTPAPTAEEGTPAPIADLDPPKVTAESGGIGSGYIYIALDGAVATITANPDNENQTAVSYVGTDGKKYYIDVRSASDINVESTTEVYNDLTQATIFGGAIVRDGAADGTGDSGSTNITMEGGKVNQIYGGGFAEAEGSTATVHGDAKVIIKGGTVEYVYGGGMTQNYTASKAEVTGTSTVEMQGGTVTGDIHGGGYLWNGGTVVSNAVSVEMSGGTVEGYLYGGAAAEDHTGAKQPATTTTGNITLKMTGGVVGSVIGGDLNDLENCTTTAGDITVTISGGEVRENVYGGSYKDGWGDTMRLSNGTTDVTISGTGEGSDEATFIQGNVFGGGSGSTNKDASVTISDNVIVNGTVYGTDEWEYTEGNSTVVVKATDDSFETAPRIAYGVYGSGSDIVSGNTSVDISAGNLGVYHRSDLDYGRSDGPVDDYYPVPTTVAGSGTGADIGFDQEYEFTESRKVTVKISGENTNIGGQVDTWEGEQNADSFDAIVAGGDRDSWLNADTHVTITDATVYGTVYGGIVESSGGERMAEAPEEDTAVIDPATIPENLANGVVIGNTNVTIDNATIYNRVFGGGFKDYITGNTTVKINNAIVGQVAAAMGVETPIYVETTGDVFGGGELNRILGSTSVTVDGADTRIAGNVFGGLYAPVSHVFRGDFGRASGEGTEAPEPTVYNQIEGSTKVTINAGIIGQDVKATVADGDYGRSFYISSIGLVEYTDDTVWPQISVGPDDVYLRGNVFGGGYQDTIKGSTDVTINGGNVGHDTTIADQDFFDKEISAITGMHVGNVYGGAFGGTVEPIDDYGEIGRAAEEPTEIPYYYIMGGVIGGDTKVTVNGGTIGATTIDLLVQEYWPELKLANTLTAGNVFGGGIVDTIGGNTNVTVTGGTLRIPEVVVQGEISLTESNVVASDGGILYWTVGKVFGGGSDSIAPHTTFRGNFLLTSKIGFTVSGIGQEVHPSGEFYQYVVNWLVNPDKGNTTVIIDGDVTLPSSVYGGTDGEHPNADKEGERIALATIAGSTNVFVESGTIEGSVFGAGRGIVLHGYDVDVDADADADAIVPLVDENTFSNTNIYLFGGNVQGDVVGTAEDEGRNGGATAYPLTLIYGDTFIFVEEAATVGGAVYKQSMPNFTMRSTTGETDFERTFTAVLEGTIVIENTTTKVAAQQYVGEEHGGIAPAVSEPAILPYLFELELDGATATIFAEVENLLRLEQRTGWTRDHWVIRGDVGLPTERVTEALSIEPKQELYMPDGTNLSAVGTFTNEGYIITKIPTLDPSIEKNNVVGQTNTTSRIYRGGMENTLGLVGAEYYLNQTAIPLDATPASTAIYWNFLNEGGKVASIDGYKWNSGLSTLAGVTGATYTPPTDKLGTINYSASTTYEHLFESTPTALTTNGDILSNVLATGTAPITVKAYKLTVEEGTGGGTYGPGDKVDIEYTGTPDPGKEFEGWDTDGDGDVDVTEEDFEFTMPDEDTTIKPVYKDIYVTLEVVDGEGDGSYKPGDTANVTFTGPTPGGYDFGGWDIDGDGDVDVTAEDFTYTMPNENVVIRPVYVPQQPTPSTPSTPTVTVTLTVVDGDGDGSYTPGTNVDVTFTGPAPEGERFVGWDVDGDGDIDVTAEDFTYTMPNENVTITPVYEEITYTLGVEDGDGDGTYTPGTQVEVTFTGPEPEGEEFIGWDTDGDGDVDVTEKDFIFTMPDDNTVIRPVYEGSDDDTFTLTVVEGDGDGDYPSGTQVDVTYTGTPDEGQEFRGWDTDGDGIVDVTAEDFTYTMPDYDVTITPVYGPIGGGPGAPEITPEGGITIDPPEDGKLPDRVELDGEELGPDDYTVDENGKVTLKPEFLATLPDGTYTLSVYYDGVRYDSVIIMEGGVPLSAGEFRRAGAWSLFDLLMTIFATISAIVFFIAVRKKSKEDEEDENDDKEASKRNNITLVMAILLAVFNIVLLFLTQDFTQPMVFFDIYSILFGLVFVIQVVLEVVFRRKKSDDEDDEQPQPAPAV